MQTSVTYLKQQVCCLAEWNCQAHNNWLKYCKYCKYNGFLMHYNQGTQLLLACLQFLGHHLRLNSSWFFALKLTWKIWYRQSKCKATSSQVPAYKNNVNILRQGLDRIRVSIPVSFKRWLQRNDRLRSCRVLQFGEGRPWRHLDLVEGVMKLSIHLLHVGMNSSGVLQNFQFHLCRRDLCGIYPWCSRSDFTIRAEHLGIQATLCSMIWWSSVGDFLSTMFCVGLKQQRHTNISGKDLLWPPGGNKLPQDVNGVFFCNINSLGSIFAMAIGGSSFSGPERPASDAHPIPKH